MILRRTIHLVKHVLVDNETLDHQCYRPLFSRSNFRNVFNMYSAWPLEGCLTRYFDLLASCMLCDIWGFVNQRAAGELLKLSWRTG